MKTANPYKKHKVVVYWYPSGKETLLSIKSFNHKKEGKEHLKNMLVGHIDAAPFPPYRILFLKQYRDSTGQLQLKIHSEHFFKK